jgi:hypothetical protein
MPQTELGSLTRLSARKEYGRCLGVPYMSENLERQRARHEFGNFLTRLLASQARNVIPGELDPPIDANIMRVNFERR